MTPLTYRQRLEFRAARLLSLIPPRWQVKLSGRPPVTIDGQTLEPEIQLLLAVLERQGRPPYAQMSLEEGREELRRGATLAAGPAPELAAVRDTVVPGKAGPLPARHYVGFRTPSPQPLIVFFHGGGFVQGGLDSHDGICRLLAKHAGAHVLSVDYRLAPESPFPAAVEDACAALGWALEHASELGADPARIAVAGDSAGGNLAAVSARVAAERAEEVGHAPILQILIYPATDFVGRTRSHELFEHGFNLTREDMDWFTASYLAGADPEDSRLSILRASDLAAGPPALVVTAGFDPLRDEGEAYAQRLRDAGVPVLLRRFPGQIHGFINMAGISASARDAALEMAGAIRALLRVAGPAQRSEVDAWSAVRSSTRA